jgi:4-amino-4-deoxy-L-arabinose transferase-like glycosyltransferase
LLRLAVGFVVARQVENRHGAAGKFLFPDSNNFAAYAHNVAEHNQYIDESNRHAWRTPLYSLLLAAQYKTVGESPRVSRIVNNLFDVFNLYLMFLLGTALFSRRTGLLAAGMGAVYPFFIYFSNLVLADTLGVTATLLIILAGVKFLQACGGLRDYGTMGLRFCSPEGESLRRHETCENRQSSRLGNSVPQPLSSSVPTYKPAYACAALVGFALALAVMVKASFALFGIFVIAFLLARLWRMQRNAGDNGDAFFCQRKATLISIPIICLAFAAGMSPWWVRNYRVFEKFVPFSTMGGFTLYESCSEYADGGPNNGKIVIPSYQDGMLIKASVYLQNSSRCETIYIMPEDLHPNMAKERELRNDEYLKYKSRRWIKSNPYKFLKLMPVKFLRTWNVVPNYEGARGWHYLALSLYSYLPVMVLALWGVIKYRREWREIYILLIPAFYFAALHTVFMGSIRYRLPAMGCIIVLAAASIAAKSPANPPRS